MAARIRPSLDDSSLLRHVTVSLESLSEIQMLTTTAASTKGSKITPCVDDVAGAINKKNFNSEERFNNHDFLLKRSYSFGFKRSLASERMVTEAVTASPWRYKRGSFWSKQPSPFGSLTKSRVLWSKGLYTSFLFSFYLYCSFSRLPIFQVLNISR
ncbi:hypothetical protein KPL71_011904 [Citrus sinensis]|uniref:Uncharacterized protein n=1 Tax=Citrus sinensis TaxID=2711 RepID=A0ACB8L6V0_CITSI|nr:hypothetical protein KPL71_011904 [Citrus sinensis]